MGNYSVSKTQCNSLARAVNQEEKICYVSSKNISSFLAFTTFSKTTKVKRNTVIKVITFYGPHVVK